MRLAASPALARTDRGVLRLAMQLIQQWGTGLAPL